jgi:hypothetical protein
MCSACIDLNDRPGFLPNLLETLQSMAALRRQARAVISRPLLAMPADIVGIRVPDSDVPVAAMALAQAAMPPILFNHCLRTFVLGMIDAQRRARKVDEEACLVGSILHDLALLAAYPGDVTQSFEENGAAFARNFSLKRGFSGDRADKIAKSIEFHAGGAGGMGADIEFVMAGAAQDVFGPGPEQLSDDQLAALERAVPRLGFKAEFLALLQDHVNRTKKPTWTAQFVLDPDPRFSKNRWSE